MTDFSFMKTGLSNNNLDDPELILNVSAMVTTFAAKALKEAAIYTDHNKRKIITKNDIKLCLKAETFQFLERKNIMKDVLKWKNIIKEDIINELKGNNNDNINEININNINENNIKNNTIKCVCENCNYINNVDKNWHKWKPVKPIEKILKNVIDKKL